VPFANGGYRPNVHFIKRITTADGKQLYHADGGNAPRVLRPEVVGMMNAMMQETIRDGTAGKADFGWPAAGKTGTSQKSKDAWFIGYTANLTTGVWFGNDDGAPTKNITGGSLPTIAWNHFMAAAHDGVPVRRLPGDWNRVPVPSVDVGEPVADAGSTKNGLGRSPRASDVPTGSIRRPSADVGGARVKGEKSLLDIILGN
jgi:penicillin-binding protein 1A